jgi:hypothetical protein
LLIEGALQEQLHNGPLSTAELRWHPRENELGIESPRLRRKITNENVGVAPGKGRRLQNVVRVTGSSEKAEWQLSTSPLIANALKNTIQNIMSRMPY